MTFNESEPVSGARSPDVHKSETRRAAAASLPARAIRLAARINLVKLGIIIVCLFLFVLSLQLIKAGAGAAEPLVRDTFSVGNPLNALGFGWLFSYVLLSGSPVAATGLVFLAQDAITNVETYAMVAGSRLGASLIVLLLGFYYVLRGHERQSSLAAGMLSLAVSVSIQVPAFIVGYVVLRAGWLDDIDFSIAAIDYLDRMYEPLVSAVSDRLPDPGVMAVGVALIVVTFNLFDRGLPELELSEGGFAETPVLVYRPSVMFLLGVAVTLVTLSVSVSLGILVPLSARGLIRRENLIPYIMGCNVTTLIDTLIVAVLLDSPAGFTVVLAGMLAIAVVSLMVLLAGFQYYERAIVESVDWSLATTRNLAIVLVTLFLIPVLLVLL